MNIKVSNISNVDVLGELLRDLTFDTQPGEVGCYNTFDLKPGFVKNEDNQSKETIAEIMGLDEVDARTLQIYENESLQLLVAWFWDGDGTLFFEVEDGDDIVRVINTDCKKDYCWEEI